LFLSFFRPLIITRFFTIGFTTTLAIIPVIRHLSSCLNVSSPADHCLIIAVYVIDDIFFPLTSSDFISDITPRLICLPSLPYFNTPITFYFHAVWSSLLPLRRHCYLIRISFPTSHFFTSRYFRRHQMAFGYRLLITPVISSILTEEASFYH